MKTLKRLLIYSLLLFLFTNGSCVKPQTHSQAYYEFRGDDFDKLLDIETGQEISYQNGDGDILTYQVEHVTDDYKQQDISGGGSFLGFPVPKDYNFYYDMKQIKFNAIEYIFARYPIDDYDARANSYTELSSEFIAQIFFFNWNGTEVWNGSNAMYSFDGIHIDYESETITMTLNGETFNNVYVIESENPEPLVNGVIVRTVNVIYYDKHHGIIGFDETDGKEWRIMN
jgi:hypothetical protein